MDIFENKIKVVWLCQFTNDFCTSHVSLKLPLANAILRMLKRRNFDITIPEMGVWNTNGISEMKKFKKIIDLHVVAPYPYLNHEVDEFVDENIHYHFFQNEDLDVIFNLKKKILGKSVKYSNNRKIIARLLNTIQPDIVHVFGAENLCYSTAVLDIPKSLPVFVQLQTLMNDPDFEKNYPIGKAEYRYRAYFEKKVIQRADYIGTIAIKFRDIIESNIKNNAVFINTTLALSEPLFKKDVLKMFDFVYFSANINKAADLAIDAFIIASKTRPGLTLDVIGSYDEEFLQMLKNKLDAEGLSNQVTFEGKLPTHNDVIELIRRSRYALLPLKIDLISGTIREAMANGLPILTTDTGEYGTQKLNEKRKTALITPIGDHKALAENMITIIDSKDLSDELRENGYTYMYERQSNESIVRKYIDAYTSIIDNRENGARIPENLLS